MRRLLSWMLVLALLLTGVPLAGAADEIIPAAPEVAADPGDVSEDRENISAEEAPAGTPYTEESAEGAETGEETSALLASGAAWDGTVDISWYDPGKREFEISTPAQLAGLAALVNGMADPACPEIIGDQSYLKSQKVDGVMLVGAGGGNVSDTVYTSAVDFAHKTVYLTADMDMGGVLRDGVWSGPNWTPIGGKFPMNNPLRDGNARGCICLWHQWYRPGPQSFPGTVAR